jgi:hypothetical protein
MSAWEEFPPEIWYVILDFVGARKWRKYVRVNSLFLEHANDTPEFHKLAHWVNPRITNFDGCPYPISIYVNFASLGGKRKVKRLGEIAASKADIHELYIYGINTDNITPLVTNLRLKIFSLSDCFIYANYDKSGKFLKTLNFPTKKLILNRVLGAPNIFQEYEELDTVQLHGNTAFGFFFHMNDYCSVKKLIMIDTSYPIICNDLFRHMTIKKTEIR